MASCLSQLVTAPAEEPLTTAELKSYMRVDGSDDDTLIAAMGAAARDWCETFTRSRYVTQTWDYVIDRFPGVSGGIFLPNPPLQSVTSISYVDQNGDSQTVASGDYTVRIGDRIPGEIIPAYNASWPDVRAHPGSVTIRFVCGYGDDEDVPNQIKQAILLLASNMYEYRTPQITGTVVAKLEFTLESLLWPYRYLEAV